jgi:hypothetical protein
LHVLFGGANLRRIFVGLPCQRGKRQSLRADERCKFNAAGRFEGKAVGPAKGSELVEKLRGAWQVSARHACRVLRFNRSTYNLSRANVLRWPV